MTATRTAPPLGSSIFEIEEAAPLGVDELKRLDAYWRAANYLSVGQIDRVPGLGRRAAVLRQQMVDKRAEHRAHVRRTGEDLPEIRDWVWPRTP